MVNFDRYKARFEATDYSQKQCIDNNEMFSNINRFDIIKAILSIVGSENRQFLLFDVKIAFFA